MIDEPTSSPAGSIRVILRAMAILDCLAESKGTHGVAEVSRQTGLSKSTVHNILGTLVLTELVAVDPSTRRYRLGPKVAQLGNAYTAQMGISELAADHMVELRGLTHETVSLHVRAGWNRVCIAQEVSERAIRRVMEIGAVRPLYAGAAGAALMAGLTENELLDYLKRTSLTRITPKTVVNRASILARYRQTLNEGFASAAEETDFGVFAIAVPIRDSKSRVVAALVVSGPLTRWNPDVARSSVSDLLRVGHELSAELGWKVGEPEIEAPTKSNHSPARKSAGRSAR
jgi:DNA-binding IclR family transcriptional regulator